MTLTDYSQLHGMRLLRSNLIFDDTFVLALVFRPCILDEQPLATGSVVGADSFSWLFTGLFAVFVPGWVTERAVRKVKVVIWVLNVMGCGYDSSGDHQKSPGELI